MHDTSQCVEGLCKTRHHHTPNKQGKIGLELSLHAIFPVPHFICLHKCRTFPTHCVKFTFLKISLSYNYGPEVKPPAYIGWAIFINDSE